MNANLPFWEAKALADMSLEEWESLCDGCGKCCLIQLQDESSEERVFTDVACELLDHDSCRCVDYANRALRVPNCTMMNAQNLKEIVEFTPPSCAYRLLFEGKSLPQWHHLVSGSGSVVHESGRSVRYRVYFQGDVAEQDLEDHVVDWPMNSAE